MASRSTANLFDAKAVAGRLERDLEEISRFSQTGPGITRLSFTPEYREALSYLTDEFEKIGFEVGYDPVGNFIASNVAAGERCLALGSHVDSVPHGGRFDGTAGVLCALELARNVPDVPLKVFSFVEEEGARFGSGLLGSRCVAGKASVEELKDYRDREKISFYEAACEAGYSPYRVEECPKSLDGVECYLEVHIEQGRVLEDAGEEIGVVEAIAGVIHASIEVEGRADHAGATPMGLRSDAGLTAAEIILEVNAATQDEGGSVVGTVGRIDLEPGALNIIPGRAVVGLDIRDVDEERRDRVANRVRAFALERAKSREQEIVYREHLRSSPTPMDPRVVAELERAVGRIGTLGRTMVSGAGHDAMIMAGLVPSGMFFVPSREGISHSPDEYTELLHLASTVSALLQFVSNEKEFRTTVAEHPE